MNHVNPIPGYPSLGLRFIFDADALIGIEHEVSVPDGGDALRISLPTIHGLLELLEFHWRTPMRITIQDMTPTLLDEAST